MWFATCCLAPPSPQPLFFWARYLLSARVWCAQISETPAETPRSQIDTNGLLLDVIWGDCLGRLDKFPYATPSLIWNGHFFLLRPVHEAILDSYEDPLQRESESEPLPPGCRYTLLPQRQTKCSFMSVSSARLYLHMRFCAALQISCICHPAVWMRCPPAWVPWIFAHPREAGVGGASICFLNRKGWAHRSCILRSAILGLAHA